jgi:hypothetical protein
LSSLRGVLVLVDIQVREDLLVNYIGFDEILWTVRNTERGGREERGASNLQQRHQPFLE